MTVDHYNPGEETAMTARYLMNRPVVTVGPDANVVEIARLMRDHNISGLPVVDHEKRVLGIVSEGDLLRRHEIGTAERRSSWWLDLLADPIERAKDYTRTRGNLVRDIMSSPAITVDEDATIGEIADTLQRHGIKRVPVVRDGRLVGIISRADVVQLVATVRQLGDGGDASDDEIRHKVIEALETQSWADLGSTLVTVNKGVVEFWGLVGSEAERTASRVATEGIGGVEQVKDHRRVREFSVTTGI
jgi:CBS domain-containing protein